jgi:hypothetical protein
MRRFERVGDHWLWIGGPVPPGSEAITLGSLVIVRERSAGSSRLIQHERVHVRQYREKGVIGFAGRYLSSYFLWRLRGYPHKGAYRRIPAEVEAYWLERLPEAPL